MAALVLFLAALLAVSALHKLRSRERLLPVTARLASVRLPNAALLLTLAASLEALAALALLLPASRSGGAAGAAIVWLGYGVILWRHRGKTLDCGCDLIARERPIDAVAVARPWLLAASAGAVMLTSAHEWAADAPFAALALLALWFAASELRAIPRLARSRP